MFLTSPWNFHFSDWGIISDKMVSFVPKESDHVRETVFCRWYPSVFRVKQTCRGFPGLMRAKRTCRGFPGLMTLSWFAAGLRVCSGCGLTVNRQGADEQRAVLLDDGTVQVGSHPVQD